MIKRYLIVTIAISCLGCDPQPSSSPYACPTRIELESILKPIFDEYNKAIELLMIKTDQCTCKNLSKGKDEKNIN